MYERATLASPYLRRQSEVLFVLVEQLIEPAEVFIAQFVFRVGKPINQRGRDDDGAPPRLVQLARQCDGHRARRIKAPWVGLAPAVHDELRIRGSTRHDLAFRGLNAN